MGCDDYPNRSEGSPFPSRYVSMEAAQAAQRFNLLVPVAGVNVRVRTVSLTDQPGYNQPSFSFEGETEAGDKVMVYVYEPHRGHIDIMAPSHYQRGGSKLVITEPVPAN